jgi:hypothetical protein
MSFSIFQRSPYRIRNHALAQLIGTNHGASGFAYREWTLVGVAEMASQVLLCKFCTD